MPKRPKQHQLEDLSRAKFQLCLPEEWVLEIKTKIMESTARLNYLTKSKIQQHFYSMHS